MVQLALPSTRFSIVELSSGARSLRVPPRSPGEVMALGRRAAFTLTELLVSLSIVAILAALAIPALRGAMDRADRAVCLSNLRQIGQALSEYTADHGHYPPAEIEVTDNAGRVVERKRWYHLLSPYLDSGPRAWSSGQGRVGVDPTNGAASGVVLPSEDDRDQDAFSNVFRCPKASHREVGRNGSYGYNHQYLGDARAVGVTDSGVRRRHYPVRPSEIADRSRTVAIMDSAGTGSAAYRSHRAPHSSSIGNHAFTVDPPVVPVRGGDGVPVTRWASDGELAGIGEPTLRSRPHGRHRGGVCVLFVDGRVEWLPVERLLVDDRLWNGLGVPSNSVDPATGRTER